MILTNYTYDEIEIGQSASLERTMTEDDILAFAFESHDVNPAHLDAEYAETTMFKKPIAHGMWTAGIISCILGTRLPGPGSIYLNQTLSFRAPVYVGDTVTVTLTVTEKREDKKWIVLDCLAVNQNGKTVVKGEALMMPSAKKVSREAKPIPRLVLEKE